MVMAFGQLKMELKLILANGGMAKYGDTGNITKRISPFIRGLLKILSKKVLESSCLQMGTDFKEII